MNAPRLPLSFLLAGTFAWAASSVAAQGPVATDTTPTHRLPPLVIPIHTLDVAGSASQYGLWGAGELYKASFHGDMTFVPYLGADYPHNQPWSFRTTSVRAGSTELLGADKAPQRWRSDQRAEYRHGPVTEAYDVRLDGLEQTFVFARNPGIAGDLVVTGAVTTGLKCAARAAAAAPLDFADQHGQRILAYGAATAIDGTGRSTAVATSWDGLGELQLTVPGEWLAAASWPVTIDPLLTTYTFGSVGTFLSPDVVRDDVDNQVVFAHSKPASAIDRDVAAYLIDDNYAGGASLILVDVTTSFDSPRIQVAIAGSPPRYALVWHRNPTSLLQSVPSRVHWHLQDGGDTALHSTWAPNYLYQSTLYLNYWRADVGGQRPGTAPSAADEKFLVVFQRDDGPTLVNTPTSSIWGCILTTAGISSSPFAIANGVTRDCEFPSVSQEAEWALGTEWFVAYQNYQQPGLPQWTVQGRLVTLYSGFGLAINGFTWQTSTPAPVSHRLAPQVAGLLGRYVVAFTDTAYSYAPTKVTLTNGQSLKTQRVDWSGSTAPQAQPEDTIFGPYANERMVLGSAAHDRLTRSHWAVVSASDSNYGGTGRTIVNRLGYHGITTETTTLESAASNEQGVPGGGCFDDDSRTFLCSWTMNSTTGGHMGIRRLSYPTPGSITQTGTGCSAATIGWSGGQQIGSEFTAATLAGGPPNLVAVLAVALAPLAIDLSGIGMTGCWLNVMNAGPDFLGTATAGISGAGAASVPLPLPEYLDSFDLWCQWFVLQPGANPLNLVSTPALRVPLVK